MAGSTGANTFGASDYNSPYPGYGFLERGEVGAGEFSYGPGLDVPGYENKPPSEGGHYKGTSPPAEPKVTVGRASASSAFG